jgi:hypothetical protein
MTVDTMPTRSCPNVFDAGLPILARRIAPAPRKPLTALTGPITSPIEFDVTPRH